MVTVFFYIFTGYNIFTGSVGKRILIVVPVGHPLQDLNHLLLDCRASEPLHKSIFSSSLSILDLWFQTLGCGPTCWVSAEFLRAPIPRKGSGSTTTTVINRCQFISECESLSPKIVTRLVDFFNGNIGVVHSLSNHTLFVRCNH